MDLSTESLLLAYPNVNKQAIPDRIELIRLYHLIQRHEQTLQELEPELKLKQKTGDALLQSDGQTNTPDAIDTDPQAAAEDGIDHLKERILRARTDLNALQSPMHPIRRCPTEILQDIFEWVVMTDSSLKRLQNATKLSHVCYRWREIAVQTPKFWTHLYASLKSAPHDIELFWNQVVERLKMRAATIAIEDISHEDSTWEGMMKCRFDMVPNIRVLKLWISTNSAAERIAAGEFCPPLSNFKTLEIGSNWRKPVGDQILKTDLNPILNRFAAFEKVVLEDFDFTNFTATAIFSKVSDLVIRRSRNLPLSLLAQAFPNAEFVHIHDSNFCEHVGGDIHWPKVETFEAVLTKKLMWRYLKMPKIMYIDLPRPFLRNGVVEFMGSHPSLQHFHTRYSIKSYSDIAMKAPQLTCISIPASEAKAALEFPNLSFLRLFQTSSSDLSSELFDTIVRRFFLSSKKVPIEQNPVKKDETPPSLSILIPVEDLFALYWRESVLVAQAIEELSVEDLWKCRYNAYWFKWV